MNDEQQKYATDDSWTDDEESCGDSKDEEVEELLAEEDKVSVEIISSDDQDEVHESSRKTQELTNKNRAKKPSEDTRESKEDKKEKPPAVPPLKFRVHPEHRFKIKPNSKSFLNSPPRRTLRAIKRRAIVKPVALTKILSGSKQECHNKEINFIEDSDSSEISVDTKDPLLAEPPEPQPSTSGIDSKLGKYGTTIKKVLTSKVSVKEVVKRPSDEEESSTKKKVAFCSKKNEEEDKKVVNLVPKNARSAAVNSPKLNYVQLKPNITKLAPNKVVLKKSSNGTYSFVSDGKVLPPESFPKAIVYSEYEKAKQKLDEPSTSEQEAPLIIKPEVKTALEVKTKLEVETKPSETKAADTVPLKSEDVVVIDDDEVPEEPEKPVTTPKATRFPQPPIKEPEPVKYVIAQGMLMATTDRLKTFDESSNSSSSSEHVTNSDNGVLFVIDQDEDGLKTSVPKPTPVPRTNDEEDSPFQIMSRPQANIELIDDLAKYRVLVRSMLKKLNMPQIDFNIDGDEYVNLYKIFRN